MNCPHCHNILQTHCSKDDHYFSYNSDAGWHFYLKTNHKPSKFYVNPNGIFEFYKTYTNKNDYDAFLQFEKKVTPKEGYSKLMKFLNMAVFL